ncbi:hypothetical protein P7C73_g3739, partial [Tremellales sp. Uapishka_1]
MVSAIASPIQLAPVVSVAHDVAMPIRPPQSPHVAPNTAFPHLHPILSGRSLRKIPTRTDGYDNFPPPLPSSPYALQRALTRDPGIEQQMAMDDNEIGPPPEGGKDAWLCVTAAFFILFCVFGFVTSFGQLQTYYLAHQLKGYSRSTVASVDPVNKWTEPELRPIQVDIVSADIPHFPAFRALFGLAFCKEYYQFLLAHALVGFAASLLYSPATAVAGHWFLRRRSTAVGFVVCGSGLGGVIYPIALKRLLGELSFRNSILVIAGMNAVLLFPSWFYLRARLPPRTPPPWITLLGPWQEADYLFLGIGAFIFTIKWVTDVLNYPKAHLCSFFVPYFQALTLATANNLPTELAGYTLAILQAGSFVGRASSGILADKFGVWNIFIGSGFLSAIDMFAFWTSNKIGTAATIIGMFIYGVSSGAWLTLVAATCGSISPTREFGMRLGMLWSVTAFSDIIGPVVCGIIINMQGGQFTWTGVFCGCTFTVATFVLFAPKMARRIRRLRTPEPDPGKDLEK